MSKPDYADEQAAILDRIGLSTEADIAANENAPTATDFYAELGMWKPMLHCSPTPELLPLAEIIERGNADGYVDVRLGRPPSAAIRWMEQRLHYENMERFGAYLSAYERAWKAGRK